MDYNSDNRVMSEWSKKVENSPQYQSTDTKQIMDALRELYRRQTRLAELVAVAGGFRKVFVVKAVLRQHKNKKDGSMTPVVDLYNKYGQYRSTGFYLNTQADIDRFESKSGLALADMKPFPGQQPLQVDPDNPTEFEYKCQSFIVWAQPLPEKEGKASYKYHWELF